MQAVKVFPRTFGWHSSGSKRRQNREVSVIRKNLGDGARKGEKGFLSMPRHL
jgi:hypothetical protein